MTKVQWFGAGILLGITPNIIHTLTEYKIKRKEAAKELKALDELKIFLKEFIFSELKKCEERKPYATHEIKEWSKWEDDLKKALDDINKRWV